ncbi:hypothetical protein [Bremerella alba]|uniref:hypothetical protein n=1 Tax=Bremerella alba TaxID=980252 RepID=UPI001F311088|nr:hypothetical protein [Bremerella alba]
MFDVKLTDTAPSSEERAKHGSAANLSKSKVIPQNQSGSKILGDKPVAGRQAPKAKSADRPKWSGEPESGSSPAVDSTAKKQLHQIPAGKESPILRSRRTLSAVILPGDRHIPALEVPWGAPCNPPKDFLKEQSGSSVQTQSPAPSPLEYSPLISPDEKEIRIEVTQPGENAPIVESEDGELGLQEDVTSKPASSSSSSMDINEDELIADVTENTSKAAKPKQGETGFHRSAKEKVIKGAFTEDVVTSDNEGGFYRPALPGQHDDIYTQDPAVLEMAMAAAKQLLGRGASIDDLEAVEGSKYVEQVAEVLAEQEGFGQTKESGGFSLPVNSTLVMGGVGIVCGVGLLILLVYAVSTISNTLGSDGAGANKFDYVTQQTSQFPVEARGPAGLVTVKFPSNFDPLPSIERPWLGTKVEGYRIIRGDESYVMMFSSSIPGNSPKGNQMPSKEQLEVFGMQNLMGASKYLSKTDQMTLDNYPLFEYHFSADILRSQPGKSRVVLLFTQQRMFMFIWSGRHSSSEVNKFFQSISVKGSPYPGAG